MERSEIKGLFNFYASSGLPLSEILSERFNKNLQPDWESFVSEADDEEWKISDQSIN